MILAAIKAEAVDAAKIVKAARQFGAFLGRGFVRVLSSVSLTIGDASTTGGSVDIDLKEAVGGVIEEYGKHVTPHEAYYNEFEDVLRRWVEDTYPVSGNRRLVVFIDDLDRCLPAIALQVLEALKLYLNVRNLVFIVGVDRIVIDRIVQKSYTDLVGEKAMDDGFSLKAARYLDKMFPVEINIEPTDEEVRAFFAKRIEPTDVWQSISPDHRELFKKILLEIGGRTPRTIVRLVNRVVVAYGRRSVEGSTTLEQELQRELLDVVCQGIGYEDLPQRSANGRSFCATWSRILSDHPNRALYLPQSEIEARLAKRDSREIEDEVNSELNPIVARARGRGAKGEAAVREPRPEFDHLARLLAPRFSAYRDLLSSLQAAKLLQIPYHWADAVLDAHETGSRKSTIAAEVWEQLRELVASSQGVDPAALTDEDLLELDFLDLGNSEVSDLLPVAALTSLTALELEHTGVADISPLAGLTKLETLNLWATQVTDISPLAGLTALKSLSLWDTQVSDFSPLAGLTALEALDLDETLVSDVTPLAGLTGLETLYLNGTRISDVSPLAGLTTLRDLHLGTSRVSDVRPLARLTHLHRLFLHNTQVSDVSALAGLPALQTLYLGNTSVSDVSPLVGHPALEEVQLPDGAQWNPQTQSPPDRYMPK